MNLNLIAYPGPAKNIAEAHIEQRIQVQHVPLKFNSEEQDVSLIAIIEEPQTCFERADGELQCEVLIHVYNKLIEDSMSAEYIYLSDDVINNTDSFILDLFDRLDLDEENYKRKTKSASLRDDVINKKTHVEKFKEFQKKVSVENLDLTKSLELYNIIKEKAIKL